MGQLTESTVNEVAADGQTYSLAATSAHLELSAAPFRVVRRPSRPLPMVAW
jgi:hypothetical protein